jgi:ubiquitin-conjugating enzyme E2 Q
VLLISGFGSGGGGGNVYPPLAAGGGYIRKGMQLRFQVGVCARYKPARAHAVEAGRTFGLVGRDAEDELREARERAAKAREAALLDWGAEGTLDGEGGEFGYDEPFDLGKEGDEEGEQEDGDEGRFERFSLSSALENLLDAQLVKLIELRREYGVGWAGAETMYAAVEREQRGAEDVWRAYQKVDASPYLPVHPFFDFPFLT